ncbi:Monooxygenase, FAD-binding [Bradyrhizobium sp. STM 3843]|uniref:FAD-dependent monooxygenase n=1 Tax=Bradyrhizobium sp. STM 3843 TaxID=551947 RepID=UPI0002405335|nr:FAD-dependent monooxygenase [Bradyrhizobium sp. STM 3843]CCE08776.1 Monooxygenase, FAD-binding [Bradyrhizobium sp. STM 3843]
MGMMTHATTPVVIVGGGPVGIGLAIDLGLRGIKSIVVERYPEPQRIPKGQNLTQRTMEHFHLWGAEEALRAARTIPRDYGIGGLTAYGSLLSGYSHDWLQRELVRPFYFTDNERLPQYATEAVLRRRAAEIQGIELLYGWTCTSLSQDADGAEVEIVDRSGGTRTLRADYVAGCDGSRSLIREQAGITQTRSDHDRLMVLLVFRSTGLHELLARYHGKSFYNVLHPALDGYWKFFGRVDLGSTWFFHAPVPADTTRDNFDFKRILHEAAGAEFDVEFEHIGFWDLRFAIADGYRAGRIFIAGDAAHSHPPYGGYGVNSGLEDAVNLSWKLAAQLQGWAGAGLLDSYSAERQPVFASTARDFIEQSILTDRDFLRRHDPARDRSDFEAAWCARQSGARAEVNAFEPNYEGSPIVWGTPGAVSSAIGNHAYAARAGHHLAPQPLSSGRNVFEELGQGFTLVALGADDAASHFVQAAADLRVPLKVINDTAADGRERYAARLILVRPDQFVAWAGDDVSGDETTRLLRRAIGGSV